VIKDEIQNEDFNLASDQNLVRSPYPLVSGGVGEGTMS